jgi:hypothetical protein
MLMHIFDFTPGIGLNPCASGQLLEAQQHKQFLSAKVEYFVTLKTSKS